MTGLRNVLSFLVGLALLGLAGWILGAEAAEGSIDLGWPEVTMLGALLFLGARLLFPDRSRSWLGEVSRAWSDRGGK